MLFGSVLYLLVHLMLHGTPEENLKEIWKLIERQYVARKVPLDRRYSTLKLTMFRATGGCKLKGRAAEIKELGGVLQDVWKMFWNESLEVHQKIGRCLRLGCHLETILKDNRDWFAFPGA